MKNETLLAIVTAEKDTLNWIQSAIGYGWTGLDEILDSSMAIHGELGGLLRCESCDSPCVGTEFGIPNGEAVILTGDVVLCEECHDAAVEARKKIVVRIHQHEKEESIEEDRSALSDEEETLAGYLDRAESAASSQAKDVIGGYPRDERSQLHRYERREKESRFLSGKTVVRE